MYKVSSQKLVLVELTYTNLKNNLIIAAKTIKKPRTERQFSQEAHSNSCLLDLSMAMIYIYNSFVSDQSFMS